MKLLGYICGWLMGCTHQNVTRLFRDRHGMYYRCVKCSKRFAFEYDKAA